MNKDKLKKLNNTLQDVVGYLLKSLDTEKKKAKFLEELVEDNIKTNNIHCLFIEHKLDLSAADARSAFYEWLDVMDAADHKKMLEERRDGDDEDDEDGDDGNDDDDSIPPTLHSMDDILKVFKK